MATLSLSQLKGLAQQVGLSGNSVNIAAAIAMAESGGNISAQNPSGAAGLWQILPSAHPQYSVPRLLSDPVYNAQAMYAISSGGRNWNPWETYTNGMYLRFLNQAAAAGSIGARALPDIKQGSANNFPMGQCTWWADQRYHDKTGYYVGWIGNAYQWEQGARASGWQVSGTPPNGIPSIIVMQPNVQGAGGLGHVGVVEKVNNNRTVTVSNMNWTDPNAPVLNTVQGYPIRQTTISLGAGISFVWATGAGSGAGESNSIATLALQTANKFKLAPNADVTAALVAIDDYLQIQNIFDIDTSGIQDSTPLGSFTDPVKWLAGVGNNIAVNTAVMLIRLIMLALGLYLLFRVVKGFTESKDTEGPGITERVGNIIPLISRLAPAAAL